MGPIGRIFSVAAIWLMASEVCLSGIVLYDDGVSQRPQDQTWLTFAANGAVTESVVAGTGVRLVTSDGVSAGYSNRDPFGVLKNPAFPVLDRNQGFSLNFELQVHQEAHSSVDRAGFSALVLTSDAMGIELGFWEDEVWAQLATPLFTHGEGAAFDTTVAEVAWRLSILGNSYSLYGNNLPVLSGLLRDYSAFGYPYIVPDLVFLGDNTSSARADFTLGAVSLAAVPEPSASLLCGGLLALGWYRRSRKSLVSL